MYHMTYLGFSPNYLIYDQFVRGDMDTMIEDFKCGWITSRDISFLGLVII